MGYYITPDGRAISVEVDVKDDGTVRPRSYRVFTATGESDESDKQGPKPHRRSSMHTGGAVTYRLTKMSSASKTVFFSELEEYLQQSNLPQNAINLLRNKMTGLTPITYSKKIRRRLMEEFSQTDIDAIVVVINKINQILKSHRPEVASMIQIFPKIQRSLYNPNSVPQTSKQSIKKDKLPKQNTRDETLNQQPPNIEEIKVVVEDAICRGLTRTELRTTVDKIISLGNLTRRAQSLILAKCLLNSEIRVDALETNISILGLENEKDNILKVTSFLNRIFSFFHGAFQDTSEIVKTNKRRISCRLSSSTSNQQHKPKKISMTDSKVADQSSSDWTGNKNYVRRGHLPQYGYARDRFGRIQERDHYREDRAVNPYSSGSSYDCEDDNDSQDILD